jgi:hypothetical protein
MEELGAQLRAASTKRRRRERRGRTERKNKGRGTTSVTPRTGGKTGTSVTEGTSRKYHGVDRPRGLRQNLTHGWQLLMGSLC